MEILLSGLSTVKTRRTRRRASSNRIDPQKERKRAGMIRFGRDYRVSGNAVIDDKHELGDYDR